MKRNKYRLAERARLNKWTNVCMRVTMAMLKKLNAQIEVVEEYGPSFVEVFSAQ